MSYTAEMYRRLLAPAETGLAYVNNGVTFRLGESGLRYVYLVTCQVCGADEPITTRVSGLSWLEQWTSDHVGRAHTT